MLVENNQDHHDIISKHSQFYERAYRIIFLFISIQSTKLEFIGVLQGRNLLPTSDYIEKVLNYSYLYFSVFEVQVRI